MIEHLPQALSHLSTAAGVIKTLYELRDFNQLNAKLAELYPSIIAAQQDLMAANVQNSALMARANDLEQECMRLKDWKSERERYTLKQIGEGVFAYVANDAGGDTQAAHKLCCNCFDKTIKSTLQQRREERHMIGLVCSNGCPPLIFTHYL